MTTFDKLKMVGEYFQAYSSEAYNDTMRATEQLASNSLLLLGRKSEAEKQEILTKSRALCESLTAAVATESPMVGALALLTAVRVHEHLIQKQAEALRHKREGYKGRPEF